MPLTDRPRLQPAADRSGRSARWTRCDTILSVLFAVLIMLPSPSSAYPLGSQCAATSSDKARKVLRAAVDLRLPRGYEVVEIVPGRSVLKLSAPFEARNVAEKRVPTSRILDIWDEVLSKYGSPCDFLTIDFISPHGKTLFTIMEGYTE